MFIISPPEYGLVFCIFLTHSPENEARHCDASSLGPFGDGRDHFYVGVDACVCVTHTSAPFLSAVITHSKSRSGFLQQSSVSSTTLPLQGPYFHYRKVFYDIPNREISLRGWIIFLLPASISNLAVLLGFISQF